MLDTRILSGVVTSLRSKASLVFHGSRGSQPLSEEGSKIDGSSGVEPYPSEPLNPSYEFSEQSRLMPSAGYLMNRGRSWCWLCCKKDRAADIARSCMRTQIAASCFDQYANEREMIYIPLA